MGGVVVVVVFLKDSRCIRPEVAHKSSQFFCLIFKQEGGTELRNGTFQLVEHGCHEN